jgi:acyl dehydratase
MGIGDENPLWLDPVYAADGPYGGIIAPPSMLYAHDKRASGGGGGLPGVHAMFAGTEWRWVKPVREGEEVKVRAVLHDVIVHQSRFAGRAVQQISECTFSDRNGDVYAISRPYSFRVERDAARDRRKYGELKPAHYSNSELREIWDEMVSERVRGRDPRYWHDVSQGELLDTIVRGPITLTDIIVFIQGWGGLYLRSHADWARWHRKHPAGGVPNVFGVPEPPERVHWDGDFARAVGVPDAYDYGPQRISWLITLITNWIGDAGWVSYCRVELRQHVLVGDTVWCSGAVTGKHLDEDGRAVVEFAIKAENQKGELVAKGTAEAIVPQKLNV